MDKQIKDFLERVRLTDEDFVYWCGSHTIKSCGSARMMTKYGKGIRKVLKCEDCRAQAQLEKVLNDPGLYVEKEALFECSECGQGNFIPLAEAISKEVD